jgi:hypothetical protein
MSFLTTLFTEFLSLMYFKSLVRISALCLNVVTFPVLSEKPSGEELKTNPAHLPPWSSHSSECYLLNWNSIASPRMNEWVWMNRSQFMEWLQRCVVIWWSVRIDIGNNLHVEELKYVIYFYVYFYCIYGVVVGKSVKNRILPTWFHGTKMSLKMRYLLRFLLCRFTSYNLTVSSSSSFFNSSIECSKSIRILRVLKLVFYILLSLPISLSSLDSCGSKGGTFRIPLLCIVFTCCFQFTWLSSASGLQFLFGILSLKVVPAYGLANLISA